MAAITALKARRSARTALVYAIAFSILVDVFNSTIGFIVQAKTIPIMKESMRKMPGPGPGPGPGSGMMEIAILFGLLVGGVWILAKLVYYALGLVVLNRPIAKKWYAGTAVPSGPPPGELGWPSPESGTGGSGPGRGPEE